MAHTMIPPWALDGRLAGRSQALRTNHCWYRPAKLLVDAGDGCAIDLGDQVGSPGLLAITHGHSDHVLGLLNLLLARQMRSLVSGGPLTILYPAGTPQIEFLRNATASLWPHTTFDRITWRALEPGERVSLGRTRDLVPFQTQHVRSALTLGYAVVERRTRLQAGVRTLPDAERLQVIRERGKDAVSETFEVTEFLHTGDTVRVEMPLLRGAGLAIMDTTFLDVADRDDEGGRTTHMTVDEALELAADADVGTLILHHLSQRYDRATLADDLRRRLTERQVDPSRVVLWDDATWTPLGPPA